MSNTKVASTFGKPSDEEIESVAAADDRFDEVAKETPQEAAKKTEEELAREARERNFEDPDGEPVEVSDEKEAEVEGEAETKETAPETETDYLKRWDGKELKDVAKAHYEAEKWGKNIANKNAEMARELEELRRQVQPKDEMPQEKKDKIQALEEKYGKEVVDMFAEIYDAKTEPYNAEREQEKADKELQRQMSFASYHKAYQEQNPDYAEAYETGPIKTIYSNISSKMTQFMSMAGCSKQQIANAVTAMNFDPLMPYLTHVILKGENMDKYATAQAKELANKEREANAAKAEFGGGASIASDTPTMPKFKSDDEEIEWLKKNKPGFKDFGAVS